jgi:hypothetical protein
MRHMTKARRLWIAGGLAVAVVSFGAPSVAAELDAVAKAAAPVARGHRDLSALAWDAGVGAGAFLATTVYGPLKTAFALGGGVVSGLAWVVSGGDDDVARTILARAATGDYVVTPSHLEGGQQLAILGPSEVRVRHARR